MSKEKKITLIACIIVLFIFVGVFCTIIYLDNQIKQKDRQTSSISTHLVNG